MAKTPEVRIKVPDVDKLLLLTEAQLKVWLYYKRREGADGKAFGKTVNIAKATKLTNPGTIRNTRSWLVQHGWLTPNGRSDKGLPMFLAVIGELQVSSTDDTSNASGCHPEMTPPVIVGLHPPSSTDDTEVPTGKELPEKDSALRYATSGSEKESKQVSPSLPSVATALPGVPASPENQNHNGSGVVANQDQNQNQHQPQTVQEFYDGDLGQAGWLLLKIQPHLTDAAVRKHLPCAERILTFFDVVDEDYQALAADMVVDWNRAHRSGKYASKDDKKLYIRTAAQYLRALESDNAALLNDYDSHEFEQCEACKERGYTHYRQFIKEMQEEQERKEEAKHRRAEEERLAKLCHICQQAEPGDMVINGGLNTSFKVCDACYDQRYEDSKRMPSGYGHNIMHMRPGYQPPKFDIHPPTETEFKQVMAWFKEYGKNEEDGAWTLSPKELLTLVGDDNVKIVYAVVRYLRKNNLTVTKDEFIALLLEAANKKAVAAAAPQGFDVEEAE